MGAGAGPDLAAQPFHVLIDVDKLFETVNSFREPRDINIFGLHRGTVCFDHFFEYCNLVRLLFEPKLEILDGGLGQLPNFDFCLH